MSFLNKSLRPHSYGYYFGVFYENFVLRPIFLVIFPKYLSMTNFFGVFPKIFFCDQIIGDIPQNIVQQ